MATNAEIVFESRLKTRWSLDAAAIGGIPGLRVFAAGSSVLETVMPACPWTSNDLDLYVHVRDTSSLKNYLVQQGYVVDKCVLAPEYKNSGFMRLNGIRSIMTLVRHGQGVQIVSVRHSRSLTDVIKNFDLSVCSVAFDFTERSMYFGDVTLNDILGRNMTLRIDYSQKYFGGNPVLHDRIAKYTSRGFTFVPPSFKDHLAAMRRRHREKRAEWLECPPWSPEAHAQMAVKRTRLMNDWRARAAARQAIEDVDSDEA